MIAYLVSTVLGILSGVITGLIPGIHPNTVIFTSLPVYLSSEIGQPVYISFITGMSISHTFHDFLPAIFLSTPDAEAALSVVAAPEMVEDGEGLEAFVKTVQGGLNSLLVTGILAVPMYFFFKDFYQVISEYMIYVLFFFLMYVIFHSDSLKHSVMVALFSGSLGIISFQANVNQQFVLIPIFSGLFAIPGIISMTGENFQIPEQKQPETSIVSFSRSGAAGTFAGLLAGTVPGIGAAVSTSFMAPLIENSKDGFLAAMGAINTSDIIFSMLSLLFIGNPRSGISVALQSITNPTKDQVLSIIALILFSVVISVPVALQVGARYQKLLKSIEMNKILYTVFLVIIGVTLWLTGIKGLLILFTSSLVGLPAMIYDERKACMAVLILPSLLSFAGIGIFI